MHRCPNCRVNIAGLKRCCPLCGGRLEGVGDPETEVFPELEPPKIRKLALRVIALLCVSVTAVCVLINMAVSAVVWWSLFVAAGSLCVFLTAAVGIAYRWDIIQNIGWQTLLISVMGIIWDWGMGWQGWSLDYVLPCVCVSGIFMMLLLKVVLKLKIQSMVGAFVGVCILGIVPGVLAAIGRVRVVLPSLICGGISIVLLAVMAFFFGQTLREEFIRRFHM